MPYRYEVATVFGGAGFLGRYVVKRLANGGAVIRVGSRYPKEAGYLRTNGVVGQITPIYVDIHDDASVAAAVRGTTMVVNLIGILHESRSNSFQAVHADAATRIARQARAAGVRRLVHVSAIGASSESGSAYARTKAAGEQGVLDAFPDATVLRPSIMFGPEDHFFNRFASMTRFSPFLPLIGGGNTRFQPVYVGDVADAAMVGLRADDARGRVYELGGPRVYTFRQLMTMTLREIGRKRRLVTVPWARAHLLAKLVSWLPNPPLTADQIEQLKTDNIVGENALTLRDLGLSATALEVILPTYLERFRVGGRFYRAGQAGLMDDSGTKR